MTDTLATHISLNWAYTLGLTARARGYPIFSCPRTFDSRHRAEWMRGYREQER